jgi:hypothetical protein
MWQCDATPPSKLSSPSNQEMVCNARSLWQDLRLHQAALNLEVDQKSSDGQPTPNTPKSTPREASSVAVAPVGPQAVIANVVAAVSPAFSNDLE